MEAQRFADFLMHKQVELSHQRGRVVSAVEFAKWIGVSNTSLSQWMNAVRLPQGENVHKLASKLGPEVYDLLGLPRMMPSDEDFREVASSWYDLDKDTRRAILSLVRGKRGGKVAAES